MILKFLKNRRTNIIKSKIQSDIEEKSKWLEIKTEDFDSIHEETFYEIVKIKNDKKLSWEQAISNPEIKNEIYELLLYRQYVGYLAEDIRRKKLELLKLENSTPKYLTQKFYREEIEKKACRREIDRLNHLLSLDLMPHLMKYEKET